MLHFNTTYFILVIMWLPILHLKISLLLFSLNTEGQDLLFLWHHWVHGPRDHQGEVRPWKGKQTKKKRGDSRASSQHANVKDVMVSGSITCVRMCNDLVLTPKSSFIVIGISIHSNQACWLKLQMFKCVGLIFFCKCSGTYLNIHVNLLTPHCFRFLTVLMDLNPQITACSYIMLYFFIYAKVSEYPQKCYTHNMYYCYYIVWLMWDKIKLTEIGSTFLAL